MKHLLKTDLAEPLLSISLNGNFRLHTCEGAEIDVPERRGQAMLALLATSPDMRHSKEWLKSILWPRSYEPQCSYSLRRAIHNIRAALGETAAVLKTNRHYVWLENVELDPLSDTLGPLFYQDAPRLNDAFSDWIKTERAARKPVQPVTFARQNTTPCLVIAPPVAGNIAGGISNIGDAICDQMVSSFRTQELVDIFDLRDVVANQLAGFAQSGPPDPDGVLSIRLQRSGSIHLISVRVLAPHSGQVLWSTSLRAEQAGPFALDFEQVSNFATQAVDAIHSALSRNLNSARETGSLFGAIHQLMSRSFEGYRAAHQILGTHAETSGLANAWLAASEAIIYVERLRGHDQTLIERVQAYCRKAIELDPSNPIVQSVVGQMQSLVLRDLDTGHEHLQLARKHAPQLAIIWHWSAMHAVYSGDYELGLKRAEHARRISPFSPYRSFLDGSYTTALALNHQHEKSIKLGREQLLKGPYLPIARHMTASLAITGQLEEASRMITEMRMQDPQFTRDGVSEPDYPMPSAGSIALVKEGFRLTGL